MSVREWAILSSAAPGNLDPQNPKELVLNLAGKQQHIFLQFFHRDNTEVAFQTELNSCKNFSLGYEEGM